MNAEKQAQARELYLANTPKIRIASKLGVARSTIDRWEKQGKWKNIDRAIPLDRSIKLRLEELLHKGEKTHAELNEMELLLKASSPTYAARLDPKKHRGSTTESVAKNPKTRKIKKVKNDVSKITKEDLDSKINAVLLPYQQLWRDAKEQHRLGLNDMPRTRMILKSRQIGATWYFAAEALEDAILTGDNQIFLSASKNQSDIFRTYIKTFAKDWFDIDLKGTDQIELSNGATLYFLATSSRTAQGYHGHIYCDEFFWIPKFNEFNKVAAAMATHKKWRKTYFSTPSAMSHEAYAMWRGTKHKKLKIDLGKKQLLNGTIGADRIWRQMTTVQDAQDQGCPFFDIKELKLENSKKDFDNLYMCKFVDDSDSLFSLSTLQKSAVDVSTWTDFDIKSARPIGNTPVWVGYDPALVGDDAAVVVVAPPLQTGGKFRVLEVLRMNGKTFEFQALQIQNLTKRYNITELVMDTSGIGYGAYQLVQKFYTRVEALVYTPKLKEQMVTKTLDVISSNRFEFSIENKQIINSFMSIGQKASKRGGVIITANRTNDSGHADVAFAIMHTLFKESVDYAIDSNSNNGWGSIMRGVG
jgi:uncharacterized protein YjcR